MKLVEALYWLFNFYILFSIIIFTKKFNLIFIKFKFQKEFQRQLSVAEFFKDPTITGITKLLTKNSPSAGVPSSQNTLSAAVKPDILK